MAHVEPAQRFVTFTGDKFNYHPTSLETIARARIAELGLEAETDFYYGIEGAQGDLGIFRTVEAERAGITVEYQKSFPWGSYSTLEDVHGCASTSEDALYIADILAQHTENPEETLAALKTAFIKGPTRELLSQHVDNGKEQEFTATIKRIVTKPFADTGLQYFGYRLDIPSGDVPAFRDFLRTQKHPYKHALLRQLGNAKDRGNRSWHMAEADMHTLDDVPAFLKLAQEFYRR